MWFLNQICNPTGAKLLFSDGEPVDAKRGGYGTSSRLIVEKQGFIDISDFGESARSTALSASFVDLNNQSTPYVIPLISIDLDLPGDGTFTYRLPKTPGCCTGCLKPLPRVSAADAEFMIKMIDQKYVPYQNIPDAPGKPPAVIAALGKQLFPTSPYSFPLAMSVYDWTTASFARMVLLLIFGYTSIPDDPIPLDVASIAEMIWESDWGSYIPSNADYMNSFMMKPAFSLASVQTQLAAVKPMLQKFADVQNRILSAAFAFMPRTTYQHAPVLFSGQPDISQLGLTRVPIEFLECQLNKGPVGTALAMAFVDATATFMQPGHVITTKMVWSFADSMDVAQHYNNGIIVIARPPLDDSRVWESASYITPLSDDPDKNEYTFAPGTGFEVLSIRTGTVDDKPVQFLEVRVLPFKPPRDSTDTGADEGDFDFAGLEGTLGFDITGIPPVATDAAVVEKYQLAVNNPRGGNTNASRINIDGLTITGHDTLHIDPGYISADDVAIKPLPRPGPLEVPMRRVTYPLFDHSKHRNGGRRCKCIDESLKAAEKKTEG